MNTVRKAVIPAAGHGTRLYPATKAVKKELFPIVDRDGIVKPAIQRIVEEAVGAGIHEVCLIVQREDQELFEGYFSGTLRPDLEQAVAKMPTAKKQSDDLAELGRKISYVIQEVQEGFGHAVYCARDWVGDEPFLLMLGDHLCVSHRPVPCASELVALLNTYNKSILAVKRTPEAEVLSFGTIRGVSYEDEPGVYDVLEIKEKPTIAYAREYLRTDGLPVGEYLCLFGQYLLFPAIFDFIKFHIDKNSRENGEIQLTNALELMRKEGGGLYAYETEDERCDIGKPQGFVRAVAAFSRIAPRT
jgi:UTP--glucose-1-phosphate uridylyltransferase